MVSGRGHILLIEDRQGLVRGVVAGLKSRGFDVTVCRHIAEAVHRLRQERFHSVLSGMDLDGIDGLALCRLVDRDHHGLPVVLLIPSPTGEVLDAATRAGAFGTLGAPVDLAALDLVVDRAVEHAALRRAVARLELAVAESLHYEDLVGSSPIMVELYDLIERAATSDAPVVICGESGTGKEVVAQILHQRSSRKGGPFQVVNVAALPDTLLESELFGHMKGAFTDARADRPGLFVQSDGGTLLLDEIGELSLALQPKLLRALQARVVRPLGGKREVPYDARIIAATNRDLEAMVADGSFRGDLYYRLNVIQVDLPPLRARGSDVLLLAQHFLERLSAKANKEIYGISNRAAGKLLAYPWPGNVRELVNCVERAVALTRNDELQLGDLPTRIRDYASTDVVVASADPTELVPMSAVESRYIQRVLGAVGGNKSQAARILGMDRKTLHRKMRHYGLEGAPPLSASDRLTRPDPPGSGS